MDLDFRAVIADSGSIGGNHSHEFHVLAASGEDDIAFSSESDYAANVEMAKAVAPEKAAASGAAVETKDAKGKDFEKILKYKKTIGSLWYYVQITNLTTLRQRKYKQWLLRWLKRHSKKLRKCLV